MSIQRLPAIAELAERRELNSADKSLENRVKAELSRSPYASFREISCVVANNRLALEGCVPTYYFKQIAQRLALDVVDGRMAVENRLRVEP